MKKMQQQLADEQENLNQKEFIGQAPDEMVTAIFDGGRTLKDLQIKSEAIDPDDPEMLSDLIIAAVNDGLAKVEKETEQTMGKYTKGIPGL